MLKKKLTLWICLFIGLLWYHPFNAQNLWTASATSDATSESNDVVTDSLGNVFITGYISGDTEFQDIEIDMTTGYSNMFVAKIDKAGRYVWVKIFGGPQSDKGQKLILAPNGDLIVTGTYYGSISFDTYNLTSVAGSKDIFLLRLDPSGNVIWARSDGGDMGDNPYGLAMDASGNIILTGQFQGTSTIAGNSFTSIIDPETLLYSYDMFVAKFDGNGNPLWAKASYAEYEDRCIAVVCDANDQIYLTGQFSDTINLFGTVVNNAIYNTGFVAHFDPSGNMQWFDKLAAAQVLAYDMELDLDSNLVLTGDFLGKMVVWAADGIKTVNNPYDRKVFVMKLTRNGEFVWATANGSNSDVSSRGIAVDKHNDLYIGGYFRCNFDEYRDSTGTAYWQSSGYRDVFVSKFSSTGELIRKSHAGGQRDDVCWAIDIDSVDFPFFTGSFQTGIYFPQNTTGFNPASYISNHSYQSYHFLNTDRAYYIGHPGDLSSNLIVSNFMNMRTSYVNYYEFGNDVNDSLPMKLIPDQDSVDYCPHQVARFDSRMNIYSPVSPLMRGKWSNYPQEYMWNLVAENPDYNIFPDDVTWPHIYTMQDGWYTLTMKRLDQCYTYEDSIHITYHPYPVIPNLTDDDSVNVASSPEYLSIEACPPDTLNFFFENICPNCIAWINIIGKDDPVNQSYSDTLVSDSTYSINYSANISMHIRTEWGCVSQSDFEYSIYELITYDSIVPYLNLVENYTVEDYAGLDTVTICKGLWISATISDSITNPTGLDLCYDQPTVSTQWKVYHEGQLFANGNSSCAYGFYPDTSGWYVFEVDLTLGLLEKECQPLDTTHYFVTDSFYVDIKDKPKINLLGAALLCPDTYNYLYTDTVFPGMTWFGPAILDTSPDNDSIRFNESGLYGVNGNYDYGNIKCPFSKYVTIHEKSAPAIIMDPTDGIVCPYDSVHLSLSATGISYDWIGPEGFSISSNPDIYAKDQGFYACIFTDNDGCQLLTPPAELREYTTPFIELSPNNVLCNNSSVEITAIYDGTATVQWQAPLSGSADVVTVNQPGTYVCHITKCGITVIDSVTIIDGRFYPKLYYSDSMLCYGDTISIHTEFGMPYYQWSTGFTSSAFYDVYAPGSYFATVYNNLGCEAQTDTVYFGAHPESVPPVIDGLQICAGEDVNITHNSAYTLNWYADTLAQQLLSTGATISLNNVQQDTVWYAGYQQITCPLVLTVVNIDVLDDLQNQVIQGNPVLCAADTLHIWVDSVVGSEYRWIYQGDTLSYQGALHIAPIDLSMNQAIITLITRNRCADFTQNVLIEVHTASPVLLSATSDTLCPDERLQIETLDTENVLYEWTDGTQTWNTDDLDLAYDDVHTNLMTVVGTNAYGCVSDPVQVQVIKADTIVFNPISAGLSCVGSEVMLYTDLGQSLVWIDPAGTTHQTDTLLLSQLTTFQNGTYTAIYTDSLQCSHQASIVIDVNKMPQFNFPDDTVVCMQNPFQLVLPSGNLTWVLNGTDTISSLTLNQSELITLTAIDLNGCTWTDSMQVLFENCSGVGADVVTPNNDGINDFVTIFNAETKPNNHFRVINRWGNIVFQEDAYRNTYSPTDLSSGVYYFEYYPDGLNGDVYVGFFHLFK